MVIGTCVKCMYCLTCHVYIIFNTCIYVLVHVHVLVHVRYYGSILGTCIIYIVLVVFYCIVTYVDIV